VNAPLLLPHSLEDLDKMRAVLSPHPQPLPEYVRRDILRHLQSQEWIVRRALLSMGTGQDLMDGKLATVKAPVLIVWGKEDVLTPPAVGEAIHREIPQSQLDVIEGCGHLVPVECKDRVLPEVGKFLR
jgi:pimeloyl-ACP methyl ester carboxylesterase